MQTFVEISCKIGLAPFNLLWQCLLVPAPWPIKIANEYNHHLCTGFWEYILFFFSPGRFMVREDGFFASITAEVAFEDLDICSTPMILIHSRRRCSTSTLQSGCSTEMLWNSMYLSLLSSVSFPFTIYTIWASRMMHEWSVAGVFKIRSQCQGLVCYHVACFQVCVGRWWICLGLFEIKTPHGESSLKSVQ